MTPLRRFEIHQPSSVAEASRLIRDGDGDAGVYAGGTELLLALRHGALRYAHLVDVKVLPGWDSITASDTHLEIGAGATHRAIERSPEVLAKQPVIASMEARVANVRVRASGTIGGNLCFAEPHSDPATLFLALNAIAVVSSGSGSEERELAISELIDGPYSNTLAPGELLTKIRIPFAHPRERSAYVKFQVHERPTLGLAVVLVLDESGARIEEARIALGCVCPSPRRSAVAEAMLAGKSVSEAESLLPAAAAIIAEESDLIDDHEGGADYKAHLIDVFLRRAFGQALSNQS